MQQNVEPGNQHLLPIKLASFFPILRDSLLVRAEPNGLFWGNYGSACPEVLGSSVFRPLAQDTHADKPKPQNHRQAEQDENRFYDAPRHAPMIAAMRRPVKRMEGETPNA